MNPKDKKVETLRKIIDEIKKGRTKFSGYNLFYINPYSTILNNKTSFKDVENFATVNDLYDNKLYLININDKYYEIFPTFHKYFSVKKMSRDEVNELLETANDFKFFYNH